MHFVYICRNGENEELRYSIRSVLSSFPDANVWVVGGKPSWYVGNYIPSLQNSTKYKNALNNINTIIGSSQIPQEFVLMNDDFFIINKITDIPNLSGMLLRDRIQQSKDCCSKYIYHKMLVRTMKKLNRLGFDNPVDYEIHVPIKVKKSLLKKAIRLNDLWRSFYGNMFIENAYRIEDVKVYSHNCNEEDLVEILGRSGPFLSTNDSSFDFVKDNCLSSMFPNKTRYEA